jgi:hypothetical protein
LEEIVQKFFNYLHAHSACPAIEAFAIDEENLAIELEMNDREFSSPRCIAISRAG